MRQNHCLWTMKTMTRNSTLYAGNCRFMAALDAGCAGCAPTTRPHFYAYTLVNDAQAMKIVSAPLSVSLCILSVLFLSSSFSFTSSSSLSFLQFNIINHDLHLSLIQTLCLHLSYSTPLRKTLTVNHYLPIEYFRHPSEISNRVIRHDPR